MGTIDGSRFAKSTQQPRHDQWSRLEPCQHASALDVVRDIYVFAFKVQINDTLNRMNLAAQQLLDGSTVSNRLAYIIELACGPHDRNNQRVCRLIYRGFCGALCCQRPT